MTQIKITIGNIGEGYVQYQSIIASLEIGKETFMLEHTTIDAENYKEDCDTITAFLNRWAIKSKENDIIVLAHKDVAELHSELEYEIEVYEEYLKLEEEKTMKRCQD